MKTILNNLLNTIIIFLFCTDTIYCQKAENPVKLISYENESPILAFAGSQKTLEETAQGMQIGYERKAAKAKLTSELGLLKFVGYEENQPVVVTLVKNGDNISGDLIKINEEEQSTEKILDVSGYIAFLDYRDGKLIAINSEKQLKLFSDGQARELVLNTDPKKNQSEISALFTVYAFQGESNLSFSLDGNHILMLPVSTQKLLMYDVKTGKIEERDEVSGMGIGRPKETETAIFYLSQSNADALTINRYDKEEGSTTELPFTLPNGAKGLKLTPSGKELLFVDSQENAYLYRLDLGRFQKLDIPVIPVSRRKGIFSDLEKVYYSTSKKRWNYISLESEKIVSQPLTYQVADDAYNLSLKDLSTMAVNINDIEEKRGMAITSGSINKTIDAEMEPYAMVSSSENMESITYYLGNPEETFSSSISVTFYKETDEAFYLEEGSYELGTLSSTSQDNSPREFVEVVVEIKDDYYEFTERTEGTVEVLKAYGDQDADIIFSITNLEGQFGELINVAGALKHRE